MTGISKWTAIARSSRLKRKPLAVTLDGLPLVLFRSGGEVHVLTDRCPHRSAPLSLGRVVDGALECPYHGWRFDGGGRCLAMPGLLGDVPRALVPRHQACEQDGLIYVTMEKDPGTPYFAALGGPGIASLMLKTGCSRPSRRCGKHPRCDPHPLHP